MAVSKMIEPGHFGDVPTEALDRVWSMQWTGETKEAITGVLAGYDPVSLSYAIDVVSSVERSAGVNHEGSLMAFVSNMPRYSTDRDGFMALSEEEQIFAGKYNEGVYFRSLAKMILESNEHRLGAPAVDVEPDRDKVAELTENIAEAHLLLDKAREMVKEAGSIANVQVPTPMVQIYSNSEYHLDPRIVGEQHFLALSNAAGSILEETDLVDIDRRAAELLNSVTSASDQDIAAAVMYLADDNQRDHLGYYADWITEVDAVLDKYVGESVVNPEREDDVLHGLAQTAIASQTWLDELRGHSAHQRLGKSPEDRQPHPTLKDAVDALTPVRHLGDGMPSLGQLNTLIFTAVPNSLNPLTRSFAGQMMTGLAMRVLLHDKSSQFVDSSLGAVQDLMNRDLPGKDKDAARSLNTAVRSAVWHIPSTALYLS